MASLRWSGLAALFSVGCSLAFSAPANPVQVDFTVKNGCAELAWRSDGLALAAQSAGLPRAEGGAGAVWTLRLQSVQDAKATLDLSSRDQQAKVEPIAGGYRVSYGPLVDASGGRHALELMLEVRSEYAAFAVTGSLRNGTTAWRVVEFAGPVVGGLPAQLEQHPLLVPYGYGMQVRAVPKEPTKPAKRAPAWLAAGEGVLELKADYPSYEASMPWLALTGEAGGLYLGVHDAQQAPTNLVVRHDAATNRLSLRLAHPLTVAPGDSWALPKTAVYLYRGGWQTAAKFYRAWYDRACPAPATIPWVKQSSGWLLAILRQQNTELIWDYPSIAKLCDVADERGLNIVGLFGWTEGGHDRWYPDYQPDERMGGEQGLKAAITAAHQRQKRIVIYYNGQLIDQGYSYWEPRGRAMTVQEADGSYAFQSWQKYLDTPARIHGLACLASVDWYQVLLNLALKAHRLGADGVIYDQLGMTAPMTCYAKGHGHPVPAVVYGADRTRLLQRVRDHMRTVQPDFLVMTEGLHDAVLGSVSLFHGCVLGVFAPTTAEVRHLQGAKTVFAQFPDLFRYTFPEVLTTIRNPRPMQERRTTNYACLFGMRHEIETRYAADKAYLLEGKMPAADAYANMVSKVTVSAVQSMSPAEATKYLRTMVDFQRTHAAFLWEGRFASNLGYTIDGPATLLARAYESGDRLAVVVWNPEKTPASFQVAVPGYRLTEAFEPERGAVDPAASLGADSIRLLIAVKAQ
ncbi:DUF6259 domain-containing protein [Opitutus sp. ER46]|uniref:DUF6259 domain-containing protein n=1 Tax=Opitutus sp. ER46 TaxID=2161864 RepID=UPI000D306B31|nr:DUF6259 domain-containing protein [Opitutus sp. ER46]PTX91381.1 hypothetical protein DB354_15920 [Opitutus sp. ER46]